MCPERSSPRNRFGNSRRILSLVQDILLPSLMQKIYKSKTAPGRHRTIEGIELLDKVIAAGGRFERVIVVGFPYGIGATAGRSVVTEGRSQGVMLLPDGDVKLIVTAPVAPGNSGGGVYVYRDGAA